MLREEKEKREKVERYMKHHITPGSSHFLIPVSKRKPIGIFFCKKLPAWV